MKNNFAQVVGVDEAGRGPLAGPVCVGAVAVKTDFFREIENLPIKDSKKLSRKQREEWLEWIIGKEKEGLILKSFSFSTNTRIDNVGISKSIVEATDRSLSALDLNPDNTQVFLDGLLKAPEKFKMQETIVKGDEKNPLIALASIVAKVKRDEKMRRYDKKFPEYKFGKHVGYGTKEHRMIIREIGMCKVHRQSYCGNI